MLLLLIPQGGAPSGLDLQYAIPDVAYRLGFQNLDDLNAANSWVSLAELYQWADRAAKHLAYQVGVFVVFDDSIDVDAGTASYALPATHVFTLAAALVDDEGIPQMLRLTAVRDLWALDATWSQSSRPATRCSMDAAEWERWCCTRTPRLGGTLSQVCQEFPRPISTGGPLSALPTVLQDYFAYAMLAGARARVGRRHAGDGQATSGSG